jgi:molybdopterin-binding protein
MSSRRVSVRLDCGFALRAIVTTCSAQKLQIVADLDLVAVVKPTSVHQVPVAT